MAPERPVRSIRAPLDAPDAGARRAGSRLGAPSLKAIDPAAARWIGAFIRISAAHPAMTRILDVIERLQDRPFRTNFLLTGEPGTGKDGLARALHQMLSPGGPLVRLDVAGFPEEAALEALCGSGRQKGAAEEADRGTLVIEEVVGLPLRVQQALLRLLKAGRVRRLGQTKDQPRKLTVNAIALSDADVDRAVADGRIRNDLYYRLARVVLWLPPLRERLDDIGPAAIWMGNRILAASHVPLELRTADDLRNATPEERRRAVELEASAVEALRAHPWPGNFRELEATLERALLLVRAGPRLTAADIQAALAPELKR
jgi:two-component system NtrC family response regulator